MSTQNGAGAAGALAEVVPEEDGRAKMARESGMVYTKVIHQDTYPFIDPTKQNLKGKIVFITGATRGIGKATAISYTKAGVSGLVLAARGDLSSLEAEIPKVAKAANHEVPKTLTLKVDVTKQSDVEAATKKIAEVFGHIDILINNAGYLEDWRKLADTDPEEWWKTWTVNLFGVYLVTRSSIPLLLKGSYKTIVNVSSMGAHLIGQGSSAYSGTKLALIRFSEYINADYGDQGILSYSLHPGGVATDLALNMPDAMHGFLTDTPELAGDAMVFLTGERKEWLANRYMSVCWDMEEFMSRKDDIVKNDLLLLRLRI